MADPDGLRDLEALSAVMRKCGATHGRCVMPSGEVELTLGDEPSASPFTGDQPPSSPEDDERRSLEMLLHSSGADVSPFLRKKAG